MPVSPSNLDARLQLSVVVAFHRNQEQLRQCLQALKAAERQLPQHAELTEIVVVADGAESDPTPLANTVGARVRRLESSHGPAVARNRGADIVRGDILVFVDTDVVVHPDTLRRFAYHFASQPDITAVFGAYDEEPDDAGFISQCKNLSHSFVHQRSHGEAQTFWAGLGAVRADVFHEIGGFDERFRRPSVEDIDLGYRIRAAGGRILLDPSIQGKHLKRWTLASAIVTDVRDRGVPWTQLMHRYTGLHNNLNVTPAYRACVVIAYLMIAALAASARWPGSLAVVPLAIVSLWWLDRPYYGFFVKRRGLLFTLAWFPFHILHHLCNGVSFAAGTALYLVRRWRGISLPGALPVEPWFVASRTMDANHEPVNHCVGT